MLKILSINGGPYSVSGFFTGLNLVWWPVYKYILWLSWETLKVIDRFYFSFPVLVPVTVSPFNNH